MNPLYPESAAADDADYHTTIGAFDIYHHTLVNGRVFVNMAWGDDYESWSYYPDNGGWHPDIQTAPKEGVEEAKAFAETLFKLIS